jgi:hypothetical protein
VPEITRPIGYIDCSGSDLVERGSMPEPAMKFDIQLHLTGLSLSNTILILETLGVRRYRSAIHD